MGIGQDGVVDKPLREGGIVAIYYLGATIGGLWGGHIADKYGRVKGVLLGCLFVLLGAPLMVSDFYASSLRSDETNIFSGIRQECCLDVLRACNRGIRCRFLHHSHPSVVG
jgi:MFS family permease